MATGQHPQIAVLIPCHDEEASIATVVDDFKRELPEATVYVFDNCCTDATAEIAQRHGAIVVREPRQGKGFVVESMFDRIRADFYVMVDGDDTYSAEHVHDLLKPVLAGDADMVVGARLTDHSEKSFPPLHVLGNNLVRFLVNRLTGARLTDVMSGYRAFNQRVVDQIPVVSAGFEVETEMTLQACYYGLEIAEVEAPYRRRPEGSESKLSTFRDGFRVLFKIFTLFREFKPLTFFGSIGLLLFLAGLGAGVPPIYDYLEHGYVFHVPLAILATGLVIVALGFVFLGVILHSINWRLRELHNVLTRKRG